MPEIEDLSWCNREYEIFQEKLLKADRQARGVGVLAAAMLLASFGLALFLLSV